MTWDIEFFEAGEGRFPVREFLDGLSSKDQVFVARALARLAEYGPELRRPHADYLRDDIYELRVNVQRATVRLFYFFAGRRVIVLTHGIKKKTDEIPRGEIDRAVEYRRRYLRRGN